MMKPGQTKTVYGALLVVLILWFAAPMIFSVRKQAPPLSSAPLSFNGVEALARTGEFVSQSPIRVMGSLESRQSTGYIHDYLQSLGYTISYSHFEARIAKRKQVGRNVLAFKAGRRSEIIALAAHLDTANASSQGAMDNGSGVGVLLELGRIFAGQPTERSLLLIFTDGGEWGMLGARDLAANYPQKDLIAAVISLDHVGIGDLRAFCLEEVGQLGGYTPPWLRELARQAGEAQGLPVRSSSRFSEYLNRAVLISGADQGPFLKEGIPAVNLGSESKDRERERAIYHTAQDTMQSLKVSAIAQYGLMSERIVRTLDGLPSIPEEPSGFLRLWDSRYARPGVVSVLQWIGIAPLALILWFSFRNYGREIGPASLGREFLAFIGTVLPFWIIYLCIELVRTLRLIPIYTLYPPPAKDPVLLSPPWGILAGVLGTALFVGLCSYGITKFSFQELPKPKFQASKIALMLLLLMGIIMGLCYNPFWTSIFLFLPAWLWGMAEQKKGMAGRLKISALIVAAAVPYLAVLGIYASRSNVGLNFIWYQVLALSSGLFSRTAYFLATAIIAIGIRFLVIQSHESSEAAHSNPR